MRVRPGPSARGRPPSTTETAIRASTDRPVDPVAKGKGPANDLSSADLIVLGSHGRRGLERIFMGSDAEQIVRLAPTPVLLVRASKVAPAATASPTTRTR